MLIIHLPELAQAISNQSLLKMSTHLATVVSNRSSTLQNNSSSPFSSGSTNITKSTKFNDFSKQITPKASYFDIQKYGTYPIHFKSISLQDPEEYPKKLFSLNVITARDDLADFSLEETRLIDYIKYVNKEIDLKSIIQQNQGANIVRSINRIIFLVLKEMKRNHLAIPSLRELVLFQ